MSTPDIAMAPVATARQTAGLLAALDAMAATLAMAEGLLRAHRRVDLAGLEAEMERLCVACLAAPEDSASPVGLRLEGLLAALDAVRTALAPP